MRIGIVTSGGGLEQIYLYELLRNEGIKVDWIAFVSAKLGRKSYIGTLYWFIRESGLKLLIFKVVLYLRIKLLRLISIRAYQAERGSFAEFKSLKLARFDVSCVSELIEQFNTDSVIALNLYSIVPKTLLNQPKLGFVNVHFGKLPNFKGMSPLLWSLAKGESKLTSSVHVMSEGIDEGPILEEVCIPASKKQSVLSLLICGHKATASKLPTVLLGYYDGSIVPEHQKEGGAYFGIADRNCVRQIRSRGWVLWDFNDFNFWKHL